MPMASRPQKPDERKTAQQSACQWNRAGKERKEKKQIAYLARHRQQRRAAAGQLARQHRFAASVRGALGDNQLIRAAIAEEERAPVAVEQTRNLANNVRHEEREAVLAAVH